MITLNTDIGALLVFISGLINVTVNLRRLSNGSRK